jgi:hypothetical protein
VVLPWTIRNYVQLDGFILISINDSSVLAGANCEPAYYGDTIGGWHLSCAAGAGEHLPEIEESARWRSDGLSYAREHAHRLPVVVPARVARTWGFYQAFPPVAEGRDRGVQTAGNVVWLAVLLPLGIAGAVVLALRRRRMTLLLLLAPVAAATIVSIVGFGMLRFRHPLELAAVVLTAVGVAAVLDRARNGTCLHDHAQG